MINLEELAKPKTVIVPVLEGKFQYHRKKYKTDDPDLGGWYKVQLQGNHVRVMEQVYDMSEVASVYKPTMGYTYNNEVVFHNCDSAKRKWGFQLKKDFYFNEAQSFSSIKVVVWEDNNIFFLEPDYANMNLYEVKAAYDEEESIENMKNITPEIRSVFIFHTMERDLLRKLEEERRELERRMLAEEERKKAEAELMRTIPGRLQLTFQRAGATLVDYQMSGNRITVNWSIPGVRRRYNSVIDARNFNVIEAGYCMSGHDKEHTLTSMVKLAEDYEDRGVTHITRH